MTSLAVASERIGNVVELTAAIARQINLLALNATIEAARRRFRQRVCDCHSKSQRSCEASRARDR
ncbi:hypothetical protein [Bradyrhizobium sp. WSM1253]|uniref:hypothetical protein n=1 Tax=Bradyrhizobium sp. WSM1253 TaxID=319003 RepID=UPI003529D06D